VTAGTWCQAVYNDWSRKKMKKLLARKFVVFVLVLSLVLCSVGTAFAGTSNTSKQVYYGEDGVAWTVLISEKQDGDKEISLIPDDRTESRFVIETNYSEDEIEVIEYEYEGGTVIPWYEKTEKVYSIDVESQDENFDAFAQSISYGSKTTEKYKKNYWYKKGNDGSKTYLQIGCAATYRIRTDNLTSAKMARCDKYVAAVKKVNEYIDLSNLTGFGTFIVGIGAIVLELLTAGVATPAVAAIITGMSSLTGASATAYIKAGNKYLDVKDYYADIKSYGTKIS
jgi:hypothetical protein